MTTIHVPNRLSFVANNNGAIKTKFDFVEMQFNYGNYYRYGKYCPISKRYQHPIPEISKLTIRIKHLSLELNIDQMCLHIAFLFVHSGHQFLTYT